VLLAELDVVIEHEAQRPLDPVQALSAGLLVPIWLDFFSLISTLAPAT
jgi:hypothetical protein